MKTTLSVLVALLMTSFLQVTAGNEKTIENLRAAFAGESTASAKYAAFSEKARQEGFVNLAFMFAATSKAEAIHAENHKKVLTKMGAAVDAVKPVFEVKTTKENIQDAIKGESYEVSSMYPGFIATAKTDDANDAVKTFRWAMETEKKHNLIYQEALKALDTDNAKSASKIYWVCPKCGNTYNTAKPEASCSFCSTKSSAYIKFDK